MEVADTFRVSSARLSDSLNRWSNSNREILTDSLQKEHDEDALRWAAIERLPTYLRVRRGILNDKEGQCREIDVRKIGLAEKKNLLERLIKIAEKDNEKFLLKLKNRIDKVGIDLPTIEVRFEHLNIEAEAYVGSRALPTMFNYTINILEGFLTYFRITPSRKTPLPILHDVSGIIKPGRMTLLLGPPSSGKTTLLLALAGNLDPDLNVTGRVTYNGHEMDEFVPQRTSAYISQHDLHLAELTVRETLAFSARCQGVGHNYEMLAELSRREKEANIKPDPDIDIYMKAAWLKGQETSVVTDYILKILGLEECADTFVGDEMIRGISGGQKKRLTTGEMMVGPAKAFFMDEISTGLDSSTAYQIVNSIKQSIHTLQGTALISLLQPAPETYELFDDIILLSKGRTVYQGPRLNVLEFFDHMGFKCPERKGVADFLQEVTSRKDQEQYWARKGEEYRFVTVEEFAGANKSFHIGKKLSDELGDPFDKAKSHPSALTTRKYGVCKKDLLRACISREFLLMKRNSLVYISNSAQLIIGAFISMTIFLRTEMPKKTISDGGIFMGALFFAVVVILYNGISEFNLGILRLQLFYKQRDLLFFPSWAYALPIWILKIPITLVDVAIWVCMTYYVTGYDPDMTRFFRQYILLICLNQMAYALFRFVGACGRSIVAANAFCAFIILAIMVLGGFVLSRDDISKWWKWGYWFSPLMYSQNAIAVNEFLGKSWTHIPTNSTESLGVSVLKSRGFFPEAKWYWIGVGALIGYIFLLNILFTLALTYLNQKGRETNQNTKCGMVLPFGPLSITFEDIRYAVDMPQVQDEFSVVATGDHVERVALNVVEPTKDFSKRSFSISKVMPNEEMKVEGVTEDKLELLKGVSGTFMPGILTALMGVSGAGKTTLLDVLAGRKTGGYIQGKITISGYPKKQKTFARIAGYCEQTDIHSPHVTVFESLQFSAWLRLPREVDMVTRKMFVEEVMELVELTALKGALVGLPGVNGLSTEQRKRLTIAVELVANPSIIFLDEPTSGLDARAAAIVMRTVRNTVNTGRTVVCTIHQPSIDIFDAFDELVLLRKGGEEIYVGPLGRHSSHLIEYFEGIKGVSKIKDGYNPATWMLDVTSAAKEATMDVDFSEIYKNSELYRRNKALIKEFSIPKQDSEELHYPTPYSQSFARQCMACLWKQHWSYWRNPQYTAVRFLLTTFISMLFGTIFWDLGSRRARKQDLFNAMGSMYAAVLFIGVQNSATVQPVVAVERTVFYRERAAGMYSALPYAFAQVVIEIPYIFVQTIIYGVIEYSMIGYERTLIKFFWHMFFMYFTLLYFTFYGMMTVAISPNHSIAAIISNGFYAIWDIFSGFVVPKSRIPVWWRWYYYMCPVSWTLYGLVASQYGDIMETLETGETVEEFIKSYFGFEYDFVEYVAVIIVGITVLFGFIFAYSIKTFSFQQR